MNAVRMEAPGATRVIDLSRPEPVLDLTDERARTSPVTTRTIPIVHGVGTGPTALAAFDHALRLTGVANYNLVRLSSVIPPSTEVVPVGEPVSPGGEWGDRLYVVYAAQTATEPGEEAWAGVAWVQDRTHDSRGLFVEHEGPTEEGVRRDLVATLSDMTAGRGGSWTDVQMVVTGGVVEDQPICALVVAAYETAPWRPVEAEARQAGSDRHDSR